MTRKLLSLTAAAAIAAASLAPVAGAADTGGDTTAAPLKVTGAYLYKDHLAAGHQDFVRVVFRTESPLPRRFDGLIRAGASIDGVGFSLGSVKDRDHCYTAGSIIKGGSIATSPKEGSGKVVRKGARIGRRFTVTIALGGSDPMPVTKTLTLRKERKGDDSGKPLGC